MLDAIDDSDSMFEAVVERADSKELIAQLMAMDYSNQYRDIEVTVLSGGIDRYVEEEGEMFPKVKKAKVTLILLGVYIR